MTRMAVLRDVPLSFRRIQSNVVARRERQLLDWICLRLPSSVTPDQLTVAGLAGAILTFASYAASNFNAGFLWLASLGLVVHWFGDSLDGSLARHRQIERPLYGYFLDHMVDAVSNLLIMTGIGSSTYVRMDTALLALIGYYLLCIYVFINNHLHGILRLSFLGFGPTELRIGLILMNVAMMVFGRVEANFGEYPYSIYDGILLFTAAVFVGIFITRMVDGARELRHAETFGNESAGQSAPRNISSLAK